MDGDGTWGHGGWLRVPALACNVRAPQRVDESRPACDQAEQPPDRAGQQGSRAARRAWSRTVRTSVQEGPLLCTDALWPLRRRIDTCMHAKHVANTLHSDKLYLLYPLRHRFQLPPP